LYKFDIFVSKLFVLRLLGSVELLLKIYWNTCTCFMYLCDVWIFWCQWI